ncbi:MAG: hypothetical protein JXC36_04765 [Candidatus Atribacteria bacterium]|nr:hypothetical protein [Candidatus Atribacteria bacterium]
MKETLNALFDFRVRKHALIQTVVFFILDKLILYTKLGNLSIINNFYSNFINYMVCLGLLIAIGCRDKIDDERSMVIRYNVFKSSFGLFVIVFGFIAISPTIITSLSIRTILYCIQGILVLHLVGIFLANRYNPEWLLKESKAPEFHNALIIALIYGLYAITAVTFILPFFIDFK